MNGASVHGVIEFFGELLVFVLPRHEGWFPRRQGMHPARSSFERRMGKAAWVDAGVQVELLLADTKRHEKEVATFRANLAKTCRIAKLSLVDGKHLSFAHLLDTGKEELPEELLEELRMI